MLAFALILLAVAGKALDHALRDRPWARRPLVEGLPLSDLYHACSGAQWPLVLWAGAVAWGAPWGTGWQWWAASAVAWGVIWPLSKTLKYPHATWQDVLAECWYMQVATTLYRRLWR